jgi:HEAT repeat protein
MTKRRKILLLLAGLVLALGVFMLFIQEREPTYQGRTLTYWVVRFGESHRGGQPKDPEAEKAIGQIGAKAVPYLLKWGEYEIPEWRQRVLNCCGKHKRLAWVGASLGRAEQNRSQRANFAAMAFEVIGAVGEIAIPVLTGRLNQRNDPVVTYRTATALGCLGSAALPPLMAAMNSQDPFLHMACLDAMRYMGRDGGPAVPALVQYLSHADGQVRCGAAEALGNLKLDGGRAVPALTGALSDPYERVRSGAAWALGRFGKQAMPATPSLQRALQDKDGLVRFAATNALLQIAPEALANAPPQPP